MTESVLISISGIRDTGGESEDIELIIPGRYAFEDGRHMVRYEEPVEGMNGVIKNTICIGSHGMDIIKEGLTSSRMSFLRSGDKSFTNYITPYGELLMGIRTHSVDIEESDERIAAKVRYSLDIENEHISDCDIQVDICSKSGSKLKL